MLLDIPGHFLHREVVYLLVFLAHEKTDQDEERIDDNIFLFLYAGNVFLDHGKESFFPVFGCEQRKIVFLIYWHENTWQQCIHLQQNILHKQPEVIVYATIFFALENSNLIGEAALA